MNDSRFLRDTLTRALASLGSSRRSLVTGIVASLIGTPLAIIDAKGKTRCKKSKRCGKGCCSAKSCFAKKVDPADRSPIGFDCCPAKLLCKSPRAPFPDQCCYPDETCRPSLVDDPLTEFETICCRPCAGKCCPHQNDECVNGECEPQTTARLPRTRRP